MILTNDQFTVWIVIAIEDLKKKGFVHWKFLRNGRFWEIFDEINFGSQYH